AISRTSTSSASTSSHASPTTGWSAATGSVSRSARRASKTMTPPSTRGPGGAGQSYARDDVLAAVKARAPRLRAASDEVESERSLTEPLVPAMADAGLYRLYLPRSLGGGELDPLTYFDVIEALAQAESVAGWSVLISTGALTITARGLPDDVLSAMFTSPRDAIMAGSGPPKGRAHAVPGGYRLTG